MPLATAIFVSSGIKVWRINRIPGRQRETGSTECVCVFYHHTSWPRQQHPLSHIFRNSAAAFSKHERKGQKKRPTAGCTVHGKHNCLTSEPGERIGPLLVTSWLCLISLWTVTALVKMFAWCCQMISCWYWSHVRKNRWISVDRLHQERAPEGSKHFCTMLLLLLLLWRRYILRFADYLLICIRIFLFHENET